MIALSRMMSLSARAGVDVYSIVDQLKSCGVCPSYAVRKSTKGDTSLGSCCPVAVGNALLELYKELQSELSYNEEEAYDDEEDDIEYEAEDCSKPMDEDLEVEREVMEEAAVTEEEQRTFECPECKEKTLIFEGGCCTCTACGYSKCS